MVMESSGGRVMRYAHNAGKVLGIPPQSMALLAVLFLRGPQTPGELRISSERWYKFADIASVEGTLAELKARGDDSGAAMVLQLPRAAGMREQRWAHLLCGEGLLLPFTKANPAQDAINMEAEPVSLGQAERLEQRIAGLESQVSQLQGQLAHVYKELGLSQA